MSAFESRPARALHASQPDTGLGQEIVCIKAIDQIGSRMEEWQAFSSRATVVAPFCDYPVWGAWLEVFPGAVPWVFELRENDQIKAILPMYREGRTLHMVAEQLLDYQDIMSETLDHATTLLLGVVDIARKERLILYFQKVAEHSWLSRALREVDDQRAARLVSSAQNICPTTTYEIKSGEGILSALVGRQRRDHRTSKKRLTAEFPDHWVEHCVGDDITLLRLEAARDLHMTTYSDERNPSIFADRQFLDLLRRQAGLGAPLTLSILWRDRSGGRPFAFNLTYRAKDVLYYYLTAYDSDYGHFSSGRYLIVESLDHFARQAPGSSLRFDMLSGEEGYKSRWASSFYSVSRVHVLPRGLRSLSSTFSCWWAHYSRTLKKWLKKRRGQTVSLKLEYEGEQLCQLHGKDSHVAP